MGKKTQFSEMNRRLLFARETQEAPDATPAAGGSRAYWKA